MLYRSKVSRMSCSQLLLRQNFYEFNTFVAQDLRQCDLALCKHLESGDRGAVGRQQFLKMRRMYFNTPVLKMINHAVTNTGRGSGRSNTYSGLLSQKSQGSRARGYAFN